MSDAALARRRHYGDFYGLTDAGPGTGDSRPLLMVVGNCQAESLRLVLDDDDVRTVRAPAIHEWTADDLEPLGVLLPRLDLLVLQPVGDDYRGLPVGTRQLLDRSPAHLRHALVPSLRYAGRHPYHVLVHPPHLPEPDPPVVPYHDLRTVVRAAWAREGRTGTSVPTPADLTPEAVRTVAADSVEQLRLREERNGTLVASDLLDIGARPPMRTINHPGNALFVALAARVRASLGLAPRTTRVTRPLLDGIHAPVEPAVAQVFGDVEARPTWLVGPADERHEVTQEVVQDEQLRWYARRGDVVDEILRRSGRQLEQLGLQAPGPRDHPSTVR